MPNRDLEERTHLLGTTEVQNDRHKCSFGLTCLLAMTFLQFWGCYLVWIDKIFPQVSLHQHNLVALVVVGVLVLYVLPIVIGWYVDVHAGRYQSLFYGICLEISGSLLCLIIVLAVFLRAVDEAVVQLGLAVFIFGFTLKVIGIIFVIPTLLTFTATQIRQDHFGRSSLIMWLLSLGSLAIYLRETAFSLIGAPGPYRTTVHSGLIFCSDVLLIFFFLLGKVQYKNEPRDQGKESWSEFWRITSTYILGCKARIHSEEDVLQSQTSHLVTQHHDRKLDRLRIRKAIMFMAIMSCIAYALTTAYLLEQIGTLFNHHWGPWLPLKLVRSSKYIGLILGAPIMELSSRLFGKVFCKEAAVHHLRIIAIASCCSFIALVAAGAVGYRNISLYWLLPQYIIMGISMFLLGSAALTLCYAVSPRGLETFVICTLFSLSILIFAIEAVVGVAVDLKNIPHIADAFFVLAGIMAVVLIVIYYPVCRWFLKAEADIKELTDAANDGVGVATLQDNEMDNPLA